MSLSFKMTGEIKEIGQVNQISEKFKKVEFIVEVENERNPQYNDIFKLQLTQDKCDMIQAYTVGDKVDIDFNLTSKPWTNKEGKTSHFMNATVWKMIKIAGAEPASIPASEEEDNLPF